MKRISYVFAVLLVASIFVARPVQAQSIVDIDALLRSLIAQVQELQRQIALLRQSENDADGRTRSQLLKLLSPNGGEALVAGEEYTIDWIWKDLGGLDEVTIQLVDSQGRLAAKPITSATKNDGAYVWKVAETPGYRYKIYIATTDKGPTAEDYSDSYFTIVSGDDDDSDRREWIEVSSPDDDAYRIGQAIPVAFDVYSSDGKPDIAITLYEQTGDKERIVNQAFYKYGDGFVRNGENEIGFYPAKGSSYDDDELTGTFRIEVAVGEILCCKYWIEPADSDFTDWFTIGSVR